MQFHLRELLLLTAAAAGVLAVSRWIITRKVPADEYLPLFVWASLAVALLTAMGWILLGAGRRLEITWLRTVSLLLAIAPVVWWIACLTSLPVSAAGETPIVSQWLVTAGAVGSGICFPLQWLAVAANLWRATDHRLLALQLTTVVLTFTGIYMTLTLWSLG